jgi:general secretion pathway protein B
MSFILDALRKSEHERERSTLPGIADAPIVKRPPSKLPWMLGGVGVLLALNVVVLLVVLLRPAKTETGANGPVGPPPAATPLGHAGGAPDPAASMGAVPAAAASPAPLPAAGVAGAVPVPATAARDVRPLSAEADAPVESGEPLDVPPVQRDPTLDADAVPAAVAPPHVARTPAGRAAEPLAPSAREAQPSAPPPRAAAPVRTTGVPSIDDLAPQATAGLPQLSINLHVYSPDPAQRFVMLNGRRYVDGAQLQEGPTLERITPDGVILNHRGLRFLLPRP